MNRLILLAAVLSLSACADHDDDPGPGAVTATEAHALKDAAAMLETPRPGDTVAPKPSPAPTE